MDSSDNKNVFRRKETQKAMKHNKACSVQSGMCPRMNLPKSPWRRPEHCSAGFFLKAFFPFAGLDHSHLTSLICGLVFPHALGDIIWPFHLFVLSLQLAHSADATQHMGWWEGMLIFPELEHTHTHTHTPLVRKCFGSLFQLAWHL